MERVDQRNGCLFVVPGSHKGDLYEHEMVITQVAENVANVINDISKTACSSDFDKLFLKVKFHKIH